MLSDVLFRYSLHTSKGDAFARSSASTSSIPDRSRRISLSIAACLDCTARSIESVTSPPSTPAAWAEPRVGISKSNRNTTCMKTVATCGENEYLRRNPKRRGSHRSTAFQKITVKARSNFSASLGASPHLNRCEECMARAAPRKIAANVLDARIPIRTATWAAADIRATVA